MAKLSKKSGGKITLEAIGAEFRRSVGVVTEHLEHKVDLVLEQHGDMVKRFDGIDARFDGIDKRLDTHMEAIGRIELNMAIVKEQLEILNSGMKQKVDLKEFEALQRRVSALEKGRR